VQQHCACGQELAGTLALVQHKLKDCELRLVHCSFCSLQFSYRELHSSHLQLCSTRTEQCRRCGKYIMLKDREVRTLFLNTPYLFHVLDSLPVTRIGFRVMCSGLTVLLLFIGSRSDRAW